MLSLGLVVATLAVLCVQPWEVDALVSTLLHDILSFHVNFAIPLINAVLIHSREQIRARVLPGMDIKRRE